MNKVALNTCVHFFGGLNVLISVGYITRVEILCPSFYLFMYVCMYVIF